VSETDLISLAPPDSFPIWTPVAKSGRHARKELFRPRAKKTRDPAHLVYSSID
jgi:hypothetical protein